jgi:hypothetical protein
LLIYLNLSSCLQQSRFHVSRAINVNNMFIFWLFSTFIWGASLYLIVDILLVFFLFSHLYHINTFAFYFHFFSFFVYLGANDNLGIGLYVYKLVRNKDFPLIWTKVINKPHHCHWYTCRVRFVQTWWRKNREWETYLKLIYN